MCVHAYLCLCVCVCVCVCEIVRREHRYAKTVEAGLTENSMPSGLHPPARPPQSAAGTVEGRALHVSVCVCACV